MNDRYSYSGTTVGVSVAQVLGGYVGQLVIADEVIWQSEIWPADVLDPQKAAFDEAANHLKNKMKELFQ